MIPLSGAHAVFFLKGTLLGFSIAAPVGPIGVLCIRRTLSAGLRNGLFTGLGAATADCLYGLVAGAGLTAISSALLDHQTAIRVIGGTFLIYLGANTLVAKPGHDDKAVEGGSLATAYGSALFLTLTNPATILSFVAIFAGLGIGATGSGYRGAAMLVGGVFFGSALWWLLLSAGVNLAREKMTPARLVWVNRFSGTVILGFAAAAFLSIGR